MTGFAETAAAGPLLVALGVSVLAGLVWVLLWGTFSAANILGGLTVALVITLLLPLPRVPVEGRVRPLSLVRMILYVIVKLVVSSFQVAWLAIRSDPETV